MAKGTQKNTAIKTNSPWRAKKGFFMRRQADTIRGRTNISENDCSQCFYKLDKHIGEAEGSPRQISFSDVYRGENPPEIRYL